MKEPGLVPGMEDSIHLALLLSQPEKRTRAQSQAQRSTQRKQSSGPGSGFRQRKGSCIHNT